MEEFQPGIYRENRNLYTRNANRGGKVYGEALVQRNGEEFREWNPSRSKAAAAIKKGVELEISEDSEILYLGAASGTTVSHYSDIVREGFIYAVEYSETVARDLVKLAERRDNIAPIIADARKTGEYQDLVGEVDIVYQDISQRDQAEILVKNAKEFLKQDGLALIAVKAQSISSSRDPEEIFGEVKEKLDEEFEILEDKRLEPYEKDHLFLKMQVK